MRRVRFIIPVFAFVVCCLISIGIFAQKRNEIRRMLDEAGRMGYPIVVAQAYDNGVGLHIVSLDGKVVSVPTKNVWGVIDSICFSNSGALLLISKRNSETVVWRADLPGTTARMFRFDYSEPPLESVDYRTPSYVGQYELWSSNDEYIINDLITGDVISGSYSIPPTWANGPETRTSTRKLIPSPDATAIVATQHYSRTYDYTAVYDIPSGVWSEVLATDYIHHIAVADRADILGIDSTDRGVWSTEFLDEHSGQNIKTIPDVNYPSIGQRWAAVLHDDPVSHGPDRLIFLDMEDNWREYSVEFSFYPFLGMAIYEPPPDGVEEMLELRRQESALRESQ